MNISPMIPSSLSQPSGQPLLKGLNRINVIVGKNGCGKSSLLRSVDVMLEQGHSGHAKYITPEHGGNLSYDGNVETNVNSSKDWLSSTRRRNRSDNFRQVSVGEFRRLETLVLRKIEQDEKVRGDYAFGFQNTINQINSLLDQVVVERADTAGFQVRTKGTSDYRGGQLDSLSSGESELICLAVEILSFIYQAEARASDGKSSFLLLDEPDVHLHPDLQDRLMSLIHSATSGSSVVVVMATHSTSILSALSKFADVTVGFMKAGDSYTSFRPISDIMKAVLPIFGAHPLSNVFSSKPILLVEGEDDERIWQQAVRSSQGKISIWPCVAGDVQSLDAYEDEIEAVPSRLVWQLAERRVSGGLIVGWVRRRGQQGRERQASRPRSAIRSPCAW